MNEKRIEKLEALFALQDQTIRDLSEELYRQQRDTTRLKQQFSKLEEQLKQLQSGALIADNERPPHY